MYEKMYPELVFSNEYYTFALQKKEGKYIFVSVFKS